MSDSRIRSAQRAVLADPTPEGWAAYLHERLRAGVVEQRRVELAAYCGHEGARQLLKPEATRYNPWCPCDLGTPFGPHTDCCEDKSWNWERWIAGLARWGHWVQTLAAVAAARVALEKWESSDPFSRPNLLAVRPGAYGGYAPPTLMGPRRAIESIEQWLRCPCEACMHKWDRAWHATNAHWCPPVWTGHVWVLAAVRYAGLLPVRSAIESRLIEWALE
jgi:hypothetical protein